MAHDYDLASSSIDKPAEHPAKAIMAKRWEERRAEARARRVAERLKLGDSGLITLKALADTAAISSKPPAAADSSSTGSDVLSATDASGTRPSLKDHSAALPAQTEESSTPTLADLAASLPTPAADSSTLAPAAVSNALAPAAVSNTLAPAAESSTLAPAAAIRRAAVSSALAPAASSSSAAESSTAAPAAKMQTPSWLSDSRKAMLVVALVSHVLLLALLYFGGFLG